MKELILEFLAGSLRGRLPGEEGGQFYEKNDGHSVLVLIRDFSGIDKARAFRVLKGASDGLHRDYRISRQYENPSGHFVQFLSAVEHADSLPKWATLETDASNGEYIYCEGPRLPPGRSDCELQFVDGDLDFLVKFDARRQADAGSIRAGTIDLMQKWRRSSN